MNLIKVLNSKISRGISKGELPKRRAVLESKLFDSRNQIDDLLGAKRDLLVNKFVPKDFKKLQTLVKETEKKLRKIKFEKGEVLRVSKQKKGVISDILRLKNELQVALPADLPLGLKDLLKLKRKLSSVKATRAFKRRTKVTRSQRRQQLSLLREKESLSRLSKKKRLTSSEVIRLNSLSSKISSLSSKIKSGEKPIKPLVGKGRTIQIQKQKIRLKKKIKKKTKKLQISARDTQATFRFNTETQKNFTDVMEEFYIFPKNIPKGVIRDSQNVLLKQFTGIVTSTKTRLSILTLNNLKVFGRSAAILRILLNNRFRLSKRYIYQDI